MIACGINDLSIGETILTLYYNGQYGTVTIDNIDKVNRIIYAHENHGRQAKVEIPYPNDYDHKILKIRKEWDNEENIPDNISANCRAYV